ncbi:MAG: DoxX-like family protein [Thermodesulfobacteriota bacterium]
MNNSKGIYVEISIKTSMDKLLEYTQTPDLHEKWDLRFSTIEYLPKDDAKAPQKFLYTTKIGFGLTVEGEGESSGTRQGESGESTSALKFWSDQKISLIRSGSGYWKYIPNGETIRFLTWYDYSVRFGKVGEVFDKWIFRPLIGRVTAWSFDCLRIWMEEKIPPAVLLRKSLIQAVTNFVLAFIWIYQGTVPKLLFPDSGELEILRGSRMFSGYESSMLLLIGLGEFVFGLFFLVLGRKFLHYLNIVVLVTLSIGAVISNPQIFVAPFNPASLNLAMIALSIAAILNCDYLATARNCLRKPQK